MLIYLKIPMRMKPTKIRLRIKYTIHVIDAPANITQADAYKALDGDMMNLSTSSYFVVNVKLVISCTSRVYLVLLYL